MTYYRRSKYISIGRRGDKTIKKSLGTGVPILTAVIQISRGGTNVISARVRNRRVSVTAAAAVVAAAADEGAVVEAATAEAEEVSETIVADVEVTEAAEAAAASAAETEAVAEDGAVL